MYLAIRRHLLFASLAATTASFACSSGNEAGGFQGDDGSTPIGPIGNGGSGGGKQSTTGAGGGPSPPDIRLGMPCAADVDCDEGGSCLLPDARDPFLGGGPANGYCTAPCAADIDCPGNEGRCIDAQPNEPGRCFLACDIGVPPYTGESDPLTSDKCRGRHDLRCQAVGGESICLPTCGADVDCPADLACDPRRAVCTRAPRTGDPLGSSCQPDTDGCAGTCTLFLTGASMCSSLCVLGGGLDGSSVFPASPSGELTECGGVDRGYCAFRPTGNGMGDYGFCTESCLQHEDCQNPAFWCFPVPELSGDTGKGYCFSATDCTEPGDCMGGEDCVDTPYGKKCISSAYPLGASGPD